MLIKQLAPFHKTKLLVLILATFFVLAGCTNTSSQRTSDNIALSQNKRIILKKGTIIQENYYQGSDLWSRMRSGFQLQNTVYNTKATNLINQQQRQLTTNKKATEQLLAKGRPYLHYILEQLESRNMPLELALLPAVESGYNPIARSHAKAAGLWQFMPRTGTHFNLQQTRWYDGRLDVIASTQAALDYLQYLHNRFNDWPLALAAYNAGEGKVLQAIGKNQKANLPTDYWHLPLPKETVNYVPKLLALSKIVLTPTSHQISLKSIPNQPYFDKITIDQPVKLSTLSSLLNIKNEELIALNAGLKSHAIINEAPKQLLIPIDKTAVIQNLIATGSIPANHHINTSLMAKNEISAKPMKTIVLKDKRKKYTIQSGDNLWAISKKNNIKLEKLLKINRIDANISLKPGQQLYISDRN